MDVGRNIAYFGNNKVILKLCRWNGFFSQRHSCDSYRDTYIWRKSMSVCFVNELCNASAETGLKVCGVQQLLFCHFQQNKNNFKLAQGSP